MASEQSPLLGRKAAASMSKAAPGKAPSQPQGGQLPQAIGHRGYKAAYPENSMAAFEGAVAVGAHAIETDLHLSKDEVVVLSHDPSLKRCFGIDEKIADCNWDYLSTLGTVKEPRQGLPRLLDLLEYLALPEQEHMWVLLDIKTDDDPETLLRRTAETIASVPGPRPWKDRIVLGGWTEYYTNLCKEIFPDFTVAYIGVSLHYGRRLLKQTRVDFNFLQTALVGSRGDRFLAAIRKAGWNVYVWTVNTEEWMEWSIRKQVNGVVTDDPKVFLDVCRRWEQEGKGSKPLSLAQRARLAYKSVLCQVFIFTMELWLWYRMSREQNRK